LFVLLLLTGLAYCFKPYIQAAIKPGTSKTISQRIDEFGSKARSRWKPYFEAAQIHYPPAKVKLVALKWEKQLQVYAPDEQGKYRHIRTLPILAASGISGPKLREGDGQVPEGIYPIESLNPNSRFHVSLRVGYPNAFDRAQAAKEGRKNLGGDIMIHGNAVSIGCLAMGDEAAEDLFVLAADTGLAAVTLISVPVDFRTGRKVPKEIALPDWTAGLYAQLEKQLAELPPERNK
jgi:hypothetical protein